MVKPNIIHHIWTEVVRSSSWFEAVFLWISSFYKASITCYISLFDMWVSRILYSRGCFRNRIKIALRQMKYPSTLYYCWHYYLYINHCSLSLICIKIIEFQSGSIWNITTLFILIFQYILFLLIGCTEQPSSETNKETARAAFLSVSPLLFPFFFLYFPH